MQTSLGDFPLREQVVYPNGGRGLFYELDGTAIIVDEDICWHPDDHAVFEYSLI